MLDMNQKNQASTVAVKSLSISLSMSLKIYCPLKYIFRYKIE